MPETPTRMTLVEHTRQLTINRSRTITIADIVENIDVSKGWLDSFVSGRTKDPGANAVQRLYEYLTGRELPY